MVVNTPFGRGPRTDGWLIRTAASQAGIPCVTLPGAMAALRGIEALREARGRPARCRSCTNVLAARRRSSRGCRSDRSNARRRREAG